MRYLWILLLFISSIINGQEIKVTSGWRQIMDASDIKNAGSDFPLYVESKKKETSLTIKAFPKSKQMDLYGSFTVFVHQEPVFWDNSLVLFVRRTSKGMSSGGTIYGGISWQEIHRFSSNFFELVGKRKNIAVQYRIKGLSVLLPVDTYSCEVVFTVLSL